MNFKTTIVLLVLLAAVGVYFGVQHFTGGEKPADTAAAADTKLVSAKSDEITKVVITQPEGKRIVLNKSGKDWRLAEPMDARADTSAVEDLLRQLTGLQSRGKLPAERKSSVGLDSPRFVVELTAGGGKITKLSVGDQSKIGDSLYVLVDDQKQPQIVATSVYAQLDKPASDYRSKKLADLPSDQGEQVKQLSITKAGKTVRLEKVAGEWQIVEPRHMPADSSAVSSLLSAITDLNASEFVQGASAPASYGLSNPTLVVSYSSAAPTTAPATGPTGNQIAFGRFATLEQKEVYASVNGGPIAAVTVSARDAFDKTALDLRNKKILDVDPAQVTSFTLSANKAATTQPTTKPAEQYQFTIARRKETPATFGPLPPAPAATQPATTEPTTQSATASTQATTQPVIASTEPTTQPAVASTQPASKWVFESGSTGNANDTEVDALLGALHPLQAIKFLEAAPTTEPSGNYNLTVHAGPTGGKGPQDYTLRITSPGATGNAIGSFEDLVFELDRVILDKLDVKFAPGK